MKINWVVESNEFHWQKIQSVALRSSVFENICRARMREILSYLLILKSTSMFYMYEAAIVNKILMQLVLAKKA